MDNYVKDMAQFLDESEYAHHENHQFTNEAIDYTFNIMKYAQKLSKKESLGGLPYPLNY